jgi:acetamidase/formamidase
MQIITRDRANAYALDRSLEVALKVRQGERFRVETQDTTGGQIRSESQSPFDRKGLDAIPPNVNPLGGPVHVEGIGKGDRVRVTIHRIDISSRQSITFTSRRGPLKDSARWGAADEPAVHVLRHEPGPDGTMSGGRIRFNEKVGWVAQPFIGTLALAPEREVHSSLLGQGAFGGNIDCRHIREGSKIFLTAQADGALLFVGDLHASQGDMEYTGVAAETEGAVELSVERVEGKALAFPRIETEESLISLHISRPLDHALHQAALLMIEWLVEEYGMKPRDAYLQLSVNPLVRANVYQMLPQMALNYVAGVEFPKSCIG